MKENQDDATLRSLREALQVSPNNVPLRRHLAELLLEREDFEGAEAEFRRALKMDPHDANVMMGLARAFHAQGKHGLALTVIEEQLFRLQKCPAAACVLHARVLLNSGRVKDAVEAYRKGIRQDPAAADADLADRLGIDADPGANEVVEGRLRAHAGDFESPQTREAPEKPRINFADVGGMEKVKDEIRLKIILPLTNKDLYAAYGKPIGGGILLYGPPGCGKTYLARATAGEIRSDFLSVGLHDILDMWIGQSEQKLHQIFEQARLNTPCVIFFDEVDALAASRADMRQSAGRHLINQFLAELDGVEASNEGVLILAATNAPWHLDMAFRRPGRFDRIIFVPPPDAEARELILKLHLRGKPLQDNLQLDKIVQKMEGFSGADIKAVIDRAVEAALTQALKQGKPVPITEKNLLEAARSAKPSTREWFASARNHALFANEGGIYDAVLEYYKQR